MSNHTSFNTLQLRDAENLVLLHIDVTKSETVLKHMLLMSIQLQQSYEEDPALLHVDVMKSESVLKHTCFMKCVHFS